MKILAKPAGVIFDEAADCMAEETLAYLKNEFASGTIKLSPWKIRKTIERAYEALGETLEKDDINIILENLGKLTEERLLNKLILRKVRNCMSENAYQWLMDELAERNISAAELKSAIRKVAELKGTLGKYQVEDILAKLEEGMGVDSVVAAYQNAAGKILQETEKFIDYLNHAGKTIRIPKQSGEKINKMIRDYMKNPENGHGIEAKVANFIRDDMGIDLTDFSNDITYVGGGTVGDIDCATEKVFIEVKTSVGSVKTGQIRKYVDTNRKQFMNIKQKKVVLYIDEPMGELSAMNARKISIIKEAGVKVVNSLEELREVMQLWEDPALY